MRGSAEHDGQARVVRCRRRRAVRRDRGGVEPSRAGHTTVAQSAVRRSRGAAARSADPHLGAGGAGRRGDGFACERVDTRAGRCERTLAGGAAAACRRRPLRPLGHERIRRAAGGERRADRRCLAVLRPVQHGAAGAQHAGRRCRNRRRRQQYHPYADGLRRGQPHTAYEHFAGPMAGGVAGHGRCILRHLLLLRARAAEERARAAGADQRLVGGLQDSHLVEPARAEGAGRLRRRARDACALCERCARGGAAFRRRVGELVEEPRARRLRTLAGGFRRRCVAAGTAATRRMGQLGRAAAGEPHRDGVVSH